MADKKPEEEITKEEIIEIIEGNLNRALKLLNYLKA